MYASDVHKVGEGGVMKFLAMVQLIMDSFCEGAVFLSLWTSTCTESKSVFSCIYVFLKFLLAPNSYTASILELCLNHI